ncbi:MAG TPA: nitronate monooxygenase [Candidatus Macondimonas sp.]|nr:nitronate monooxygenase [Candidatus Macondimonas sp.]
MTTPLHRPVCDLLGCRYPLVLAGMGGVARAELVTAVSRAGGFGFLGMVREPVERIRAEVAAVRAAGVERFGVNLIPAGTDPALLTAQIETLIALAVPVAGLFWDVPAPLVARLRAAGLRVVCQVGSVDEARAAEAAGADALIAQGVEAGGHVRGDQPLHALLGELPPAVSVPVLAAGGLADGADVATVLALGAQGAVFGTALIATKESFAHDYHKQRLVTAAAADTLLTEDFHINWPPGAKVRVLANSVTRGERGDPVAGTRTVIGEEEGRPIYLFSTDSPLRSMSGDFEAMALYAGTGVGRIDAIVGAGERLARVVAEAEALLAVDAMPAAEAARLSSPACFAAEADAQYMGEIGRDELLAALDELLEAERAGARVALHTARDAPAELTPLVRAIQHDEARWCALLTQSIQRLGGTPSRRTGDFHEKAMAIEDLPARLAFLNRGQRWVVRRLQALLPRVIDPQLQAGLGAMLAAHEANIARVTAALDG